MRSYLYVANPVQLVQIAAGAHNATHQMPPEGMGRGIDLAGPGSVGLVNVTTWQTDAYVDGPAPAGHENDWYWGTVGEFLTGLTGIDEASASRFVNAVGQLLGTSAGAAANAPLLKKGSEQSMRWIRVTHRGELAAGVEQFQWKLDLGVPGDDPSLSEAAAPLLAEQLAGYWAGLWGNVQAGGFSMSGTHNDDVVYTEIGCVEMTATSATDSSGEGGNMAQSYATGWFAWPLLSQPKGTQTSSFSLPYEVSCAVTLQTDHRGPSGRGRFFLPPFASVMMADHGVFDVGATSSAGQAIADYFELIISGTPYVPIVVSPRRLILNAVKQVNIGKVPDSQRRRRRNQDEARVAYWTTP